MKAATPSNDTISSLRRDIDTLVKEFTRTRTAVVDRQGLRKQTRDVVKVYFNQHRPALLQQCQEEGHLQPLDTSMQKLLSCCNARTSKTKYLAELRTAKKGLDNIELKCLLPDSNASGGGQAALSAQDVAIINTLRDLLSSACKSYEQGLHDLEDRKRQSWRGPVAEFREALRETLDHLAPDADIKKQSGFKLEPDQKGPTMKQKVVFILKSRQAGSAVIDTTKSNVDLIEEKTGAFVRSVYNRSSASTHGVSSREEAISIKKHIALILSELLKV
ncbi:MAG: hypothetical protein HZA03_10565 [Nitrospinae bacterium]|nr:hypothetical protein [Nitrospinota bacterium]